MLLFAGDQEGYDAMTAADQQAMLAQVGAWWEQNTAAGKLKSGDQLQPPRTATTVRHRGAEREISDGPFIEAKEQVGGFAIVEVASLDEALELAKSWPAGGAVEVRPVVEMH
ncbi:MAG: hypothetical protein JOY80_08125 [Candidatus Dormibacteraeota bacterium]|nr:hypothetical protein [Candidatus Dormibacteraeota bacterium]